MRAGQEISKRLCCFLDPRARLVHGVDQGALVHQQPDDLMMAVLSCFDEADSPRLHEPPAQPSPPNHKRHIVRWYAQEHKMGA